VKNTSALNSNSYLRDVIDVICQYNNFKISQQMIYDKNIISMLKDTSYIILQSFGEECYLSVDIHKYGEYVKDDYERILDFLIQAFDANPLWSSMRDY
jgi:hypothetical protein